MRSGEKNLQVRAENGRSLTLIRESRGHNPGVYLHKATLGGGCRGNLWGVLVPLYK